jgi:hypothetical protein
MSRHIVRQVPNFVFVTGFQVQLFCFMVEQRLFCHNLSCRESALLQTSVDAASMCAVISVSFLLDSIHDPTNVMIYMGLLMRGMARYTALRLLQ